MTMFDFEIGQRFRRTPENRGPNAVWLVCSFPIGMEQPEGTSLCVRLSDGHAQLIPWDDEAYQE